MNEYDIIRTMAERFPRSPDQLNKLFGCDAELIEIGGEVWGLTIDDFSPEEDLFTCEDPELLGANLATATLSDLLAAGVEPKFFMHALSLPKKADTRFIEGLSDGIKSILDQTGCALCGGDVGTAESWRFCGFAMGPVASGKPITHILPDRPQTLWITGELGDANLAALQNLPTPRLELRMAEAKLIREHGTACIDTSGGFMDAVWLLHEQNPEIRLEIHLEKLPMFVGIAEFSKKSGIPGEAALLGGAGEYELLFATEENLGDSPKQALLDARIKAIGSTCSHAEQPGVYLFRNGEMVTAVSEAPPCPRVAESVERHAQDVMRQAMELFSR